MKSQPRRLTRDAAEAVEVNLRSLFRCKTAGMVGVALLEYRAAMKLDLWTGKPLRGKDALEAIENQFNQDVV